MDRQHQFVGMYDLRETLGKGHFSVVKLAEHVLSKQKVAIKVIEKARLNAMELEHLHHEVRVMKMLHHPNVVRLYQVFDTAARLYLILELGSGGDLYEYITHKNGRLSEEVARSYFSQIVSAVKYCHKHRVAHRDLKPENVVFCDNPDGTQSIKVTDFGLSNNFSPGEMMKTMCGSLCYSAPEVLLQEPYDGPAADIWSLGIILFMMVAGRLPFKEHDDSTTLFKILDVKYEVPGEVSGACKDLIARMIVRVPEQRISLDDIERHAWMQGHARVVKFLVEDKEADERGILKGEEHQGVLRKMKQAGIEPADVETALSSNAYDYVTSTYFLLAEQQRQARRPRTASADDCLSSSTDDPDKIDSSALRRHPTIHGNPRSPKTPPIIASPPRRLSAQGIQATGKHTGSLRRVTTLDGDPFINAPQSPQSPTSRISLSQSFPAGWQRNGLSPSEVFREELMRTRSVPEERNVEPDTDSICSGSVDDGGMEERQFAAQPMSNENSSRFCVIS